jgi:hypothetical protein
LFDSRAFCQGLHLDFVPDPISSSLTGAAGADDFAESPFG